MAREHGKILAIPPEELKEVAAEEPDLSDIILKAFLARRSWGPYELKSMKRAPTPPSSRTSGRTQGPQGLLRGRVPGGRGRFVARYFRALK